MTTVEELVDEIRRHFSPDEFLDISKSAPLAAKLRLLSYQLSDGLVKPADMEANKEEYALDWHAVESEKFSKKPTRHREDSNTKHALHEAWDKEQERRERQREMKQRDRRNRARRDEFQDQESRSMRMEDYMAKISSHIAEGSQWSPVKFDPGEDPVVEVETRIAERRQNHFRMVKADAKRAQEQLAAKESELSGFEERLAAERAARRQGAEEARAERERQLKEQEEYRLRRQYAREQRRQKLEEADKAVEAAADERIAELRSRQAEALARREAELKRREEDWAQWEVEEENRREEARKEKQLGAAEVKERQTKVVREVLADDAARRLEEERELDDWLAQQKAASRKAIEAAGLESFYAKMGSGGRVTTADVRTPTASMVGASKSKKFRSMRRPWEHDEEAQHDDSALAPANASASAVEAEASTSTAPAEAVEVGSS